jgi:hypothetical protein
MPGYLGRFQQGTELPVVVQCEAAGSPAWPLAAPTLSVFGPTGVQFDRVMGAAMQGVTPGTFRLSQYLGLAFAATGMYGVVVRYTDALGQGRMQTGSFYLLPGGSPDGAVVAMQQVRRPAGQYLLWQTDSGRLVRGLNPR